MPATSTDMRLPAAPHQAAVGLALAGAIFAAWLANHVMLVWVIDPLANPFVTAVLFALQVWLSVGLFIVSHDAMHGSVVPFQPRTNAIVGQIALALYAGFSYRALIVKHHRHHRFAGTADDPDFDHENPDRPVRWYIAFMSEYMSWRLFGWVTLLAVAYSLALFLFHPDGAWRWLHVFLFWLFPSLIASVQLFWFGTFLPHRHEAGEAFGDRHNARSTDYPVWLSLLTCFHFGYHHEHHDQPGVPWWRLPALRERTLHAIPSAEVPA